MMILPFFEIRWIFFFDNGHANLEKNKVHHELLPFDFGSFQSHQTNLKTRCHYNLSLIILW